MEGKAIFDYVSIKASRLTTHQYSTSFSIGIKCLHTSLRDPIYSIYGFVRFADEIVDSFHDFNKEKLLSDFRRDTFKAIIDGISLNPILNSFQKTVNEFEIDNSLIEQFLKSMEMDLTQNRHDEQSLDEYILGSAEVVGLMCLRVFTMRNEAMYRQLKPYAMKLGAAFQKVNFLRDAKADFSDLGRIYFPGLEMKNFTAAAKQEIEASIKRDFDDAYMGIKLLPREARLGVYVAYLYYIALFKKIQNTPSERVLQSRIRIHNRHKISILCLSFVRHQLNLI